jgi:hypothetical protein
VEITLRKPLGVVFGERKAAAARRSPAARRTSRR